ncbi:hypothetical protein GN958_ATG19796 [Phytophthora infestans]|uniref:Uncharacterized protein n=1 Tax=Phytophthora infestans TaxID=4787 RepID=A0A8S9TTZ4_PHYIN|nr:hypothetical protein GN958_ATG19796 [Phytophthora infestans]
MLEGDLCKAFEDAAFSDDDVRLAEEFTRALYKASIVVLPVDYSEKRKENIFEITKPLRMDHTPARLSENSPMCKDALCRRYKRGLPYEGQNKYDASGQVYANVAALVLFFERIEQGEQRLSTTTSHNTKEYRALRQDHQQDEHQQVEQRRDTRAAQRKQRGRQTRVE